MRWKENDYSRKYDSTPRDPPDLPKTPENNPVQLATMWCTKTDAVRQQTAIWNRMAPTK